MPFCTRASSDRGRPPQSEAYLQAAHGLLAECRGTSRHTGRRTASDATATANAIVFLVPALRRILLGHNVLLLIRRGG